MRRVYTKKELAKEHALKARRKTRAKLIATHPDLMAQMRDLAQATQAPAEELKQSTTTADSLWIDKQKNIGTILQFLEIQKETKGADRAAIKALLLKHMH